MAKCRRANGEGYVRKIDKNKFECSIQSKYINPKTGKIKRIKRQGSTEEEAIRNCKMAVKAWEKSIEAGKDEKVLKSKTFGMYMEEYIENEVKNCLTASGYHTYISSVRNNFYPFPIANLQLHMLNAEEFRNY
ncbi:MAG: hypothetical protein NC251_01580 [Lachnoclostridium sp.]|nr:hypothetical protein [Lachnospira sp.]MCM1247098.1 hypothetical protein [Lachnoclostridium sp.]